MFFDGTMWKEESVFTYKKPQPNSVITIFNVLKEHPFLSENEIMINAFGYNRNISRESNKKYTDMLRRALRKGTIKRVKANVVCNKSKFFYYLPECNSSSEVGQFRILANQKPKQESKIVLDRKYIPTYSMENKEIIRLFDEFLNFKGKIPFDELKPDVDDFLQHKGIKPKPIELTEEELIRIAIEHLGEPVKLKK